MISAGAASQAAPPRPHSAKPPKGQIFPKRFVHPWTCSPGSKQKAIPLNFVACNGMARQQADSSQRPAVLMEETQSLDFARCSGQGKGTASRCRAQRTGLMFLHFLLVPPHGLLAGSGLASSSGLPSVSFFHCHCTWVVLPGHQTQCKEEPDASGDDWEEVKRSGKRRKRCLEKGPSSMRPPFTCGTCKRAL